MEVIYRIKAEELSNELITKIKKLYKGKDLELTIQVQEDETEYLLKSKANRTQLFAAIKDVKKNRNMHTLDMHKLKDVLK